MGHRLSKLYTRTGDQGQTGLGNGSRVSKDAPRMEALGDIDELNSAIGVVLSLARGHELTPLLTRIQHDLFDLGGEISIPGHCLIQPRAVERLEQAIDEFNKDLPHLKEFILPGGGPAAAHCHLARAVCRRAERHLVSLAQTAPLNDQSLIYLNRLSDLLFVAARVLSREEDRGEPQWRREWN
ncbi:MAG TPA: cob(I)yrinic acid a,c-diamide adenosyltransferase [Gammaproteobacteria bacterium]|nr:cob(I)yrinic acid a,c-diamide adenosyltransferase [Gammaproteobacteria bacterium]